MIQACILLLSMSAAITLSFQEFRIRRWGYWIGLSSQPFWFIATCRAEQWGMFALAFFYTGTWSLGVYNHWFKPRKRDNASAP